MGQEGLGLGKRGGSGQVSQVAGKEAGNRGPLCQQATWGRPQVGPGGREAVRLQAGAPGRRAPTRPSPRCPRCPWDPPPHTEGSVIAHGREEAPELQGVRASPRSQRRQGRSWFTRGLGRHAGTPAGGSEASP